MESRRRSTTTTATTLDATISTISVVDVPHSDITTNRMIRGEAGVLEGIRHVIMVIIRIPTEGIRDPTTVMVWTHSTNGRGVAAVIEKAAGESMNIENDVEMIHPTNQEAETRKDVHTESQMVIVADGTEKNVNSAENETTTTAMIAIAKGTTNATIDTIPNDAIVMRGKSTEAGRKNNSGYLAEKENSGHR